MVFFHLLNSAWLLGCTLYQRSRALLKGISLTIEGSGLRRCFQHGVKYVFLYDPAGDPPFRACRHANAAANPNLVTSVSLICRIL